MLKKLFLKDQKWLIVWKVLSQKDYIEVETPILQSIAGGAAEGHCNAS